MTGADGIWSTKSKKTIEKPLYEHEKLIRSVAYSPDGTQLVSASDDGTLRIWNAITRQPIGVAMGGHEGGVRDEAFLPNGNYLVSGGEEGWHIQLWSFTNKTPIGSAIRARTQEIRSVAFSPNEKFIASGGDDKSVRVWNANIFDASLNELVSQAKKLCPLSEAERRQLGVYDPQAAVSAKPLTPEQCQACGEHVYP